MTIVTFYYPRYKTRYIFESRNYQKNSFIRCDFYRAEWSNEVKYFRRI